MRLQRGFSQEQLAKLAGLSINAISSFERGLRFPRPRSLDSLAGALGAEPSAFMSDVAPATTDRGTLADILTLLSRANNDTLQTVLELAKVIVVRDHRRLDVAAAPVEITAEA